MPPQPPTLAAALKYLTRGWSAIPLCPPDHALCTQTHRQVCNSPGKTPWFSWQDYQQRLARPTELQSAMEPKPQEQRRHHHGPGFRPYWFGRRRPSRRANIGQLHQSHPVHPRILHRQRPPPSFPMASRRIAKNHLDPGQRQRSPPHPSSRQPNRSPAINPPHRPPVRLANRPKHPTGGMPALAFPAGSINHHRPSPKSRTRSRNTTTPFPR